MTEFKIQRYYKLSSLAIIGIGLSFVFIPTELPTNERIWAAALLNIGFHMMFQFHSGVPIRMYRRIEEESPRIKKLVLIMLKVFSVGTIVITGLATIAITSLAISEATYSKLLTIPVLFGVVIGSLKSWLNLKYFNEEWDSPHIPVTNTQ